MPKSRFELSQSDFHKDTPPDVVSAVLMLQAHGFTVLREAPMEVGVETAVDLTAYTDGDPEAMKRATRRRLAVALGETMLPHVSLDVRDVLTTRNVTARAFLVAVASPESVLGTS